MNEKTEPVRAEFEAWAKPFFFSLLRSLHDTDEYDNLTTQAAWMAWQARTTGAEAMSDFAPYILIRIKRPEDYADVHPELLLEDFLSNPRDPVWEVEIVPGDTPEGGA